MSSDSIIEKIRALLDLAGDEGATRAEAVLAAEKAQEMMLKYNIDAAHVAMSEGQAKALGADTARVDTKVRDWKVWLASGVADSVGGKIVITPTSRYTEKKEGAITFICPAGSAEAAGDLFSWLTTQLELISVTESKNREEKHIHGRTWRRSWLEGAAVKLAARLRERVREAETQETAGALVLMRDVVQDKMDEMFGRLGSYRGSTNDRNGDAYRKGVSHGSKMDIGNPQIGNKRELLNA